jgi:hypothetical protein
MALLLMAPWASHRPPPLKTGLPRSTLVSRFRVHRNPSTSSMAAASRGLQFAGGVAQGCDARGCVARAAAYTEPELVLLEALLGV